MITFVSIQQTKKTKKQQQNENSLKFFKPKINYFIPQHSHQVANVQVLYMYAVKQSEKGETFCCSPMHIPPSLFLLFRQWGKAQRIGEWCEEQQEKKMKKLERGGEVTPPLFPFFLLPFLCLQYYLCCLLSFMPFCII